jgi:hypothetical protein
MAAIINDLSAESVISSKSIARRCKTGIEMTLSIRREKFYGFQMGIEIASDFEFIVSASRLKETTKGGFSHETYSQKIYVSASIEKALNIFDFLVKKIESGLFDGFGDEEDYFKTAALQSRVQVPQDRMPSSRCKRRSAMLSTR